MDTVTITVAVDALTVGACLFVLGLLAIGIDIHRAGQRSVLRRFDDRGR